MIIDDYIDYTNTYKAKYGDKCLVLMQVGSFYEVYSIIDDTSGFIYAIADICNIQISKKNKALAEVSISNPLMAGFPIHSIKKFTSILLNHNYTIVLIEQVTEPPLPTRKVTEILSPGMNINIENKKNGACARYLNYKKDYRVMPDALFAHGNSGLNIRMGKALVSERDKQISSAVFGNGAKDKEELGDGVYKQFGIGKEGFNISSCQFALHYFFENEKSLHSFLRNVSECTRVNGYFVGTCYDGETVFNILKSKNQGETMTIYRDKTKIYEITKQYNHTGFPEDEQSLNYPIDVYQESINKVFREYLVNFNYLQRIMENYGFSLVTKEEAEGLGLPNGSGLFDELFNSMNIELERNFKNQKEYKSAQNMTKEEKKISFMNRYFVFRKTHNVNAEKVYKLLVTKDKLPDEEEDAEQIIEEESNNNEKLDQAKNIKQPISIRKLPGKKRKLVKSANVLPGTDTIETTELKLNEQKKTIIIRKSKKKD